MSQSNKGNKQSSVEQELGQSTSGLSQSNGDGKSKLSMCTAQERGKINSLVKGMKMKSGT